jgi:hypothetical protein
MRFWFISDVRGVVTEAAAVVVFMGVTAAAFALPASADPADPDPYNPADCMANANAICNLGPYGPNSPSNPNSAADPMNPMNPANPNHI